MPKEFDELRAGILKGLRKQFPKESAEKIRSRSWAVAVAQWKKMGKPAFWKK